MPAPPPSSGLNVNDLLFIFYRHKLKIAAFILIGCLAAAGVYFLMPAPFESTAKLLVRYVVERSTVDNVVTDKGEQGPVQQVGAPSEAILNSEVEILTSSDLALEVAKTVGPRRLLPTAPKATVEEAAIGIRKGLEVAAVKDSNIISVTYRNKNPKLAVEVLDLIVERYLEKHLEVHRSAGTFTYVSKEAERMGNELAKTEGELKTLKEKYGVTTIAETVTNNSAELTRTQADLDITVSDLATQKVNLAEIDKFFHGQNMLSESSEASADPPDNATRDRYANLVSQIEILRKAYGDLASRFAPGSKMLKSKEAQLEVLEKQKQGLEKKYPILLVTAVATGTVSGTATNTATAGATEIILQRARLAGLETRENELKRRILALKEHAFALGEVSPKIAELERTRDVQQASYLYYKQSLEKAQIDEGLNPSRMPNISVVQNPSPSVRSIRDLKKVLIGLSIGSIVGGLALALFLELVIDRTVKRSRDLEGRLHLPLMLAIPVLPGLNGERLRLTAGNGEVSALDPSEEVDSGQLLRPFCESIRDRLGFYFGMNNMTHKPKLVAVTGLSKSAGVTSLAAGLAAAFSEGEENRVILVDKPTSPKRFYDMLASFKESKLDYIIFDMPAVGDLSATLPMAGFMDKVLLVVEAEKSGREAVKRAFAELSARTDVSVIFNKSRTYGPKWLEGEI
jgi:uncharacterized protein involved in exopolysaccharide biosynthesis/Mrp family chromosome partitioning ATPase